MQSRCSTSGRRAAGAAGPSAPRPHDGCQRSHRWPAAPPAGRQAIERTTAPVACATTTTRLAPAAAASAAAAFASSPSASSFAASPAVAVTVDKPSWNSRRLFASVPVAAPLEAVWGCLTDYERLDTFIPSLVTNRCLERRPRGATLYQVGAQEVALGVKFSAACKLDINEHAAGAPAWLCSPEGGANGSFPLPRPTLPGRPVRDLTFSLIEGDFEAFKGVWRMQSTAAGGTLLCYALYVMPQRWLPVGLIQSRIEREVAANLDAVRRHAERLAARAAQPGASGAAGGARKQ